MGTTRNRWAPLLDEGSGLVAGEDFHLVFSPERVLTGRVFADLRKYPKLVGGVDAGLGAARASSSTRPCSTSTTGPTWTGPNGVWDLGSAEAAELAKLAETTYRDVNIGLANQFARYADTIDVDVNLVIDACNTQPYSHIHRPGHRGRRALHPGLPAAVPVERPGGHRGAVGPRGQRGDAGVRGGPARRRGR